MNAVFVAEIGNTAEADFKINQFPHPVLFLTIKNGAAHTRAAEAIARAWQAVNREIPTRIVDVSTFMSPLARFTHVSVYLWLVKNAPAIWGKIDSYQKRQTQTSPEWFYRRECRKLFELVCQIQPAAIVATEVGCGEIGALIKRDLKLNVPFVAVDLDYDFDRAWIQPEVDCYSVISESVRTNFIKEGTAESKIKTWGAPLDVAFTKSFNKQTARSEICQWLNLQESDPLILVAGGGEGLGKIKKIVERLLEIKSNKSIVVLTGTNQKLKRECDYFAKFAISLRILSWTDRIPQLFQAADLLISKLGLTFDEACACGLPIVALPPPPGAERSQYNLLKNNSLGRSVKTVEEMGQTVEKLIADKRQLERMSLNAKNFSRAGAAEKVAAWLTENINKNNE